MPLRFLIVAAGLVALTNAAHAETRWIVQKFQHGICKDVKTGKVDEGEDFIIRRCATFPDVSTWVHYQEGTRMHVGFGKAPHTALSGADATRSNWPVVWGGEKQGKKFTPQVAIARFTFAGEEPRTEHLMVFRLLANGTSCVVGDVRKNQEAQDLATAAMKTWTCLYEPTPLP
jgi:hypothetical protein